MLGVLALLILSGARDALAEPVVIDTISVGPGGGTPFEAAVNTATNRIYTATAGGHNGSVIEG